MAKVSIAGTSHSSLPNTRCSHSRWQPSLWTYSVFLLQGNVFQRNAELSRWWTGKSLPFLAVIVTQISVQSLLLFTLGHRRSLLHLHIALQVTQEQALSSKHPQPEEKELYRGTERSSTPTCFALAVFIAVSSWGELHQLRCNQRNLDFLSLLRVSSFMSLEMGCASSLSGKKSCPRASWEAVQKVAKVKYL